MADKLVTIAEYADSMQAEMTKQLLEDFGIKAVVVDQNIANLCLPPVLSMTAKLQVLQSDEAKAIEIMESAQSTVEADETQELEEPDEQEQR